MMDIKEIKQLLKLMDENNLSEITIKQGEDSVSLKKKGYDFISTPMVNAPAGSNISAATIPNEEKKEEPVVNPNLIEIKSPMVGTFYRAPSPDAAPFVDVGQDIGVGTVLCILEAMKLMNEVKSEVAGKIVKILVENGQPVEFGQILFLIEK